MSALGLATLSFEREDEVAGAIGELIEEMGWTPEEVIPGLLRVIKQQVVSDTQLDAAVDLLADGREE